MNEQELRERLRGAVLDEPPLVFDPDRAVDSGRLALRRRRAVLASTGATVAALAAVAGLTALGTAEWPAAPSAATAPTISTSPPPVSREQIADEARRLREHLDMVFPTVVPTVRAFDVGEFAQEGRRNAVSADVNLSDLSGYGAVIVRVGGVGGALPGQETPSRHVPGSRIVLTTGASSGNPTGRSWSEPGRSTTVPADTSRSAMRTTATTE